MTKDIAKLIGYPAFVILGALAIDGGIEHLPYVFGPLMVLYPLIIVLFASDPAVYRLPFKYRLFVVAILAVTVWWFQNGLLNLGFWLAFFSMSFIDPEGRARSRRVRAWIRGLSHNV